MNIQEEKVPTIDKPLPVFEESFPLTLTETAREKLIYALKNDKDLTDKHFVRVGLKGGGCSGFIQELDFDDSLDPEEDLETTFEVSGEKARLVVDVMSAAYLKGTVLDYVKEGFKEGFKFIDTLGKVKKTCGCGASVSY